MLHQVDQQSSQLVEGWVGCPEEAKSICMPYLQQMDLRHARQQGETAELGLRTSTVLGQQSGHNTSPSPTLT